MHHGQKCAPLLRDDDQRGLGVQPDQMTEEFFDTVFMYLLSEDNYISNYIVNSFYSEKKLRRHLLFHLEDEPFLEALLRADPLRILRR